MKNKGVGRSRQFPFAIVFAFCCSATPSEVVYKNKNRLAPSLITSHPRLSCHPTHITFSAALSTQILLIIEKSVILKSLTLLYIFYVKKAPYHNRICTLRTYRNLGAKPDLV
jgi:hypothetical protein